jgi:hypothetical protein
MSQPSRRRTLLRVFGIVAILLGVVVGLAVWTVADQRLADAVDGLARAPIGCDTVLDFDEGGTYVLFVETKGELDDVRGDCEVDTRIDWTSDELPTVTLTLADPEGSDVDLESDDGVSYDAGDAAGESIYSVDIETPGDHTLRVESDDSGFAIAVGRDPNNGVLALRAVALVALAVGVVFGAVLLIGSRRRRADRPASTDEWVPEPGTGPNWPMSPPGFPAPPPTTGTTAVVGPPTGTAVGPAVAPLPTPPPTRPSVAPIPGQPGPWGPPPPGKRPGT